MSRTSGSRPRTKPKSSRDKVRAHRARKRRQGFRLVQMWLPDTSSKEFKAEAHRQSLAVARSPHAKEDQDFIDAITDVDALYETDRRRD